jgi:hypothetical protein
MSPLTNAQKQQRRREALDKVAQELGYETHYRMMTAIIRGEIEMTKISTLKLFDEYDEAESHAHETGFPLWDTKTDPGRYAVGHLTIEEEEDLDNQEWTEIFYDEVTKMDDQLYYTIDREKLEEVTAILNAETDPRVTESEVQAHICGDWHEGDEHQEWINSASTREIADWISATVYS